MEVGWSFLWNITDETPTNCQLFLASKGLKLFEECFAAFSTERELVSEEVPFEMRETIERVSGTEHDGTHRKHR